MKRGSGILLHISSLPNKHGIGTMGGEAYKFVDFLSDSGQKHWQILPIVPTGYGNSPYLAYSAFAGSALLISLDMLVEDGLLSGKDLIGLKALATSKVEYDLVDELKSILLRKSFFIFQDNFGEFKEDYYTFLGENSWWLDDYALFRALKQRNEKRVWNEWEKAYKKKDENELKAARHEFSSEIYFQRFVQFVFFRQWFALKKYANKKGISFIGDLPLYVSLDSADVWANQDIFALDDEGKPSQVGGVPPDYFSKTGQLWGCPVFNWERLQERDFDWWIARMHFNLKMFDYIRIDHFRGLESFWSVAATEKTAMVGEWLPAKGNELLSVLKSQLGNLPVIAEDLGIITPEVEALRDKFQLPGMKVLQFAFTSDATNVNLPHNYDKNIVVYTGTHDNDTTLGWVKSLTKQERKKLKKYFGLSRKRIPKKMIELAWSSVADTAILPLQDLLGLDSTARMNIPGIPSDNWEWRFKWNDLKDMHARYLKEITELYNR